MILAALLCGLLTAYYFGVRPGMSAAAVVFGLFLAGAIFPPLHIISYLAVGGGIVAVTAIGARRPRDPTFGRVVDIGKRLAGQVWKRKPNDRMKG
jgi:hypothetical protein